MPNRLLPIQQALLPFQFADLGQILADLQGAPVLAVGSPYGEVTDINKLAAQFDPELRCVPGTGFEGIQDLIDQVDAFGGMAVANLPADDGGAAWKDPFRALGVVSDPVVLVNKG